MLVDGTDPAEARGRTKAGLERRGRGAVVGWAGGEDGQVRRTRNGAVLAPAVARWVRRYPPSTRAVRSPGGRTSRSAGRRRGSSRRPTAGRRTSQRSPRSMLEARPCRRGSARAAADYLLGERDTAGKTRGPRPEILHGDPAVVAAVADSLEFKAQVHLRRDRQGARGPADPAHRSRPCSTGSRRRPGPGSSRIAAPRSSTARGAAASTCTASPRATSTAGASPPTRPGPRRSQTGHRALINAPNLRAGLAVETDPGELIRDYLLQRVEPRRPQPRRHSSRRCPTGASRWWWTHGLPRPKRSRRRGWGSRPAVNRCDRRPFVATDLTTGRGLALPRP